jgi:hypothetical protein
MGLKLVGILFFTFITITACRGEIMNNSYSNEDITIQALEQNEDGLTKIFYSSILETLYFCPGANVTETKEKITVEFIRCSINEKCEVTHPAMQEGQDEYILIDKGEKSIFLKHRNELFSIPPSKS